jgi:hypothetical protein
LKQGVGEVFIGSGSGSNLTALICFGEFGKLFVTVELAVLFDVMADDWSDALVIDAG